MTEDEYNKRLRAGAGCTSLAEYDVMLSVEGHWSGRPWLDPVWRYFWLSEHPRALAAAGWINAAGFPFGAVFLLAGITALAAPYGFLWFAAFASAALVSAVSGKACGLLVDGFEHESRQINLMRNPRSGISSLCGVLSSVLLAGSVLRPKMFTGRNL